MFSYKQAIFYGKKLTQMQHAK